MRPLRLLIAIVFLAVGLVLGVLNANPVTVDLGVVEVKAGLGVILLCTLLAGVLIGALTIVASVVLPLRGALRRVDKQTQTQTQKPETSSAAAAALPSLYAPSET